MNSRTFLCLLLLAFAVRVKAQNSGQLTLSQEVITAGDEVSLSVAPDQPAPCDTLVRVQFNLFPQPTAGFQITSGARQGQTEISLKQRTYHDIPAGEYRSTEAFFDPCPGFSTIKRFTIPQKTLMVKAYVDTTVYPTTADLTLKPTDHQFFDTKIAELNNLDGQLLTKLDGNAADVPELRRFLVQTVRAADDALSLTERQYRLQIMKSSSDPSPGFFADFHREYQGLIVDLSAPIPGTSAQAGVAPVLLYVQLKKRNPSDSRRGTATYPPTVKAVRKTIADNAAVYKYVSTTGRISFDARFSSVPTGATVKYKKVIDDVYKDYSAPTDVPKVTLELAAWQFIFHMDGCIDQPRQIDPWDDTTPDYIS